VGAAELPGCARLELAQGVVRLNPQEAAFEGMLAGWARQQRSRFLREEATFGARAALVRRLAGFAGQYPWEWEPAETEAFIAHLRSWARPVTVSTARGYEAALAAAQGSFDAWRPAAAAGLAGAADFGCYGPACAQG
jgi:hypothetical protein